MSCSYGTCSRLKRFVRASCSAMSPISHSRGRCLSPLARSYPQCLNGYVHSSSSGHQRDSFRSFECLTWLLASLTWWRNCSNQQCWHLLSSPLADHLWLVLLRASLALTHSNTQGLRLWPPLLPWFPQISCTNGPRGGWRRRACHRLILLYFWCPAQSFWTSLCSLVAPLLVWIGPNSLWFTQLGPMTPRREPDSVQSSLRALQLCIDRASHTDCASCIWT